GCDESRRLTDRDSRRERAKRCSPNPRVDELARAQALVIGASPRQGAPVSKRADVGRARADVEKEALAAWRDLRRRPHREREPVRGADEIGDEAGTVDRKEAPFEREDLDLGTRQPATDRCL